MQKDKTYGDNWDQYYLRTYGVMQKKALWDVSPELAAGRDFESFNTFFNSALPLIDLGCGTGTQETFLANHYQQVIGVDVSKEAIQIAKENVPLDNVHFDVLDATDTLKAKEIHLQFGDSNIYMRGVLHQILKKDLGQFCQVVLTLMGTKGRMYCVEVADSIRTHFENSETAFSKLPKRMRQVFISNLPPRGLSLANLTDFFPETDFKIVDCGHSRLMTNIHYPNGSNIYIPAVFASIEPLKQ